jgi:hypothetical protein
MVWGSQVTLTRVSAAHHSMLAAEQGVDLAVLMLQVARKDYAASKLPAGVRSARVAALDAKIAALRDVHAGPNAHPWVEDLP